MQSRRSFAIWLLLLFAVTALCGCRSNSQKINPGTGDISLKVWVVLDQGDFFGFPGNVGCRLNGSQITDFIEGLRLTSNIFGLSTNFLWDGTRTVITDQQLTARPQNIQFWQSPVFLLWQNGFFDPLKLNIYFVGNVQLGGNMSIGYTQDPSDPFVDFNELPAFVLINDGGFNEDSGFYPGFSPSELVSYHVLEHEMTHYLARFTNMTFGNGPQTRTYNSDEHVPSDANNILRTTQQLIPTASFPLPLVIPGSTTTPQTELKQIWDRIFAGAWNNP